MGMATLFLLVVSPFCCFSYRYFWAYCRLRRRSFSDAWFPIQMKIAGWGEAEASSRKASSDTKDSLKEINSTGANVSIPVVSDMRQRTGWEPEVWRVVVSTLPRETFSPNSQKNLCTPDPPSSAREWRYTLCQFAPPARENLSLTEYGETALTLPLVYQALNKFCGVEFLLTCTGFGIELEKFHAFVEYVDISLDKALCGGRNLADH